MNKKAILFDFDGVLVNTLPMCWEVHHELNPTITFDEYSDLSNGNFHAKLKESYKGDQNEIQKSYFEKYRNHLPIYTIGEELVLLIEEFSKTHRLFIVSSCVENIIEEHLTREHIREYFTEVLGYNFHSGKTEKILHILDKYSLEAKDTVFVTDTLGDIVEATEAGIDTIAETWGLHDRGRLEKGSPIAIVDTVAELKAKISEVLV